MSDLVGNPEDRFSHDGAHIKAHDGAHIKETATKRYRKVVTIETN